jgi:GTPase SAR1 family protein
MARVACPFCFREIDSARLAFQCTGNGTTPCGREEDELRVELTGNRVTTHPTFDPPESRFKAGSPESRFRTSAPCPECGGAARRRACPSCHTVLPIDFVNSDSPMIGLVGAKGSGKTVLMTVLVHQLRDLVGRRFGADIRLATDRPDGQQGIAAWQDQREKPLFEVGTLPPQTEANQQRRREPIVLRWRQEVARPMGLGSATRSTILSFVDTAGEDLNDEATTFSLQYLAVADALVVVLDPFMLPGAREQANVPDDAIRGDRYVTLDVLGRITELLRTQHGVRTKHKIKIPMALVFTKIDAFYPVLDRSSPLLAAVSPQPVYDEAAGQAVHENVLALMHAWGADDIDRHMCLNYKTFRYFAVSALGAPPDYGRARVADGGVRPHRVEDPLLWLLSKQGAVTTG